MIIDAPHSEIESATTEPTAEQPPITEHAAEEKPLCIECRTELTWRDTAYVPEGARVLCKRCYQRHTRKARERGKFTPASIKQERGGKVVEVPVRSNRAARRGHSHGSADIANMPAPKEHRRTRAERRAAVRKAKAAQVAA